ncbi:phosphotransferase enzyme family protein [Stachybotrys elegans]|uniref:Phosphotransferase enzyme family protein n=1 Tax=Stachybotrys elegans TaxID=80388 RepID=A0A8K0WY91_9HYPO|nr:phosphotransferase enzyme family protein [Stachybotrys elegans]
MLRKITKEDLAEATSTGPFCAVRMLADGKTVVKTGELTRMAEANTMKYIRQHTKIPVPEVYNAYADEETGHVRIVMERIEGETLQDAWDSYNDEEKETVAQQLRGYFDELRQIKGSYIGSVDGSACDDQYFSDNIGGYGPYQSEADFNQGLITAWSKGREDDPFTQLLCRIQVQCMKGHSIVMTHNDFAPRNIMVRGTQVVAVLDWEFAGFYPEYWEYCKALWRPSWDSSWIKDGLVERVLDPHLQEAAVILNTSYTIW